MGMHGIEDILQRNHKVEMDKAWETSKIRRGVIAVITYLVAVAFMMRIGVTDSWLNALVPTGGYILSTLSLPFIKRWWLNKYHQ
ncbi:hypothetical protein KC845_01885 [Candidatus Kaiserbacteria bacterium]|nr:hypothetical protein [Candidatus Kaiserbacteria bacterium]